jgi:hypothetical protein
MKKELRPFHDHVTCEVCGRTILKGEGTEAYLAPGGERHGVCELCFVRAEHAGWIRESGRDEVPTRGPLRQERRPLLGRLRRRPADPEPPIEDPPEVDAPSPAPNGDSPRRRQKARGKPQDPRHVRAVPTTAEVKAERALELFNASEHQRTIAGLARSLGPPWATAVPDPEAPSTVTILVAWELSWYRYRVDLGDAAEPVALREQGNELEEVREQLREWNAGLDAAGRLVIGVAQQ